MRGALSLVFAIAILCTVPLTPQRIEAQSACERYASASDVANIYQLFGVTVPVGTCLDETMTKALGLDTGGLVALKYLESKVCPGKKAGYDPSIPPSQLKETRVYFSALDESVDPKFLVCAANFVKAAEAAGFAPCVNAALRTQEHQRASCMDPSNSVVCGRTSSNPLQCRKDLSSCPHVDGKGMDLNSLNGQIDKIVALANSGTFGVKMGVKNAYDPWHMEPLGVTCTANQTLNDLIKSNGGTTGTGASSGTGGTSGLGGTYGTYGAVGGTVYSAPTTQNYSNLFQSIMLGITAAQYYNSLVGNNSNAVSYTDPLATVLTDPTYWPGGTYSTYQTNSFYPYSVLEYTPSTSTSALLSTTGASLNTASTIAQSTSSTISNTLTAPDPAPEAPLTDEVRAQLIVLYTKLVEVLRSILSILTSRP